TANPVRRIDRETEHCAPLHHRDAWIVDPLDELRTETSRIQMPHSRPGLFLIEHGLRMDRPFHPIRAGGQTEISTVKFCIAPTTVIVAKDHHVTSLIKRHARIKHRRGGKRTVVVSQHRIGWMAYKQTRRPS